jgi:hypothetical protein
MRFFEGTMLDEQTCAYLSALTIFCSHTSDLQPRADIISLRRFMKSDPFDSLRQPYFAMAFSA